MSSILRAAFIWCGLFFLLAGCAANDQAVHNETVTTDTIAMETAPPPGPTAMDTSTAAAPSPPPSSTTRPHTGAGMPSGNNRYTGNARIRQFPYPAPKASSFKRIPRQLLHHTNSPVTLGYVLNQRLLPALDAADYEYSFYSIRDSGVAVVTRMERMKQDGSTDLENRYVEHSSYNGFSDYVASLFRAKPGFYRMIVFVLSPYPLLQSDRALSRQGSDSLFARGADRPAPNMETFPFSDRYACTALIYEYKKPNQEDAPRLVAPSPLTCEAHLRKAGIWQKLESIR